MSRGERIQELRKNKGWSQADLAVATRPFSNDGLGVSQQLISKLERDIVDSSGEIIVIAQTLGTSVEYLEKGEQLASAGHHGISENVIPYRVNNPEDLAEEKALYFADEFERLLEIRLSSHDKRELFKRMRDRYLRQLTAGQKVPDTEKEMEAEVIDFIEITKQMKQ